ncbi:MAG: TonB-dependent receptor [Bacteroidetes bacterium]|nr:TonB-dependent receptor [Bacteroidota bacterium]
MKKILLFGLLLGISILGNSQIITVIDYETGRPLDLVTLVSNSPRAFALTNPQGQADITAFKGAEKIEFRLMGYKTITKSYSKLKSEDFMVIMEPSMISLDQVVVSATRWSQPKRDIPAKITSITPKDFNLQNPQTAADLLGISGEVFIQKSQQGGGSPMIRGFSTNRLLYTIDGVRMNTAIFRSGNLQNVISLDPFAIENTEIYFGPGSIIYGSDAIGAVMSFQTLTPRLSITDKPLITGMAEVRHATANNEITGHFNVNVGWKKWALLSSFTSYNYDDLRMGSFGPEEYLRPFYVQRIDSMDVMVKNDDPKVQTPTGYSQMNIMQKVRFSPNEHWDFQYGFHYSTTSDYARYDRHIRLRKGLPRSAEWNYGPQVWAMNNLSITHNGNNVIYDQMTIRLAQQYFEESRIDRDFNGTMRYNRLEKVDAYSANIDFQRTINENLQLYYGLEAVLNDVTSTGTDEDITTGHVSNGPSRYPQSTWTSYAAYFTGQYHFGKKFMLQAGARYNKFDLDADFSGNLDFYPFPFSTLSINDGALTGSLGFTYNPDETWTISLNGSTGFRSPNVDDIGKVFDSEPGSVVVPNPDLQAEYAYNGEIDIAKVFGEVIKIDLTAFYTQLDNAMVRRDFTLNGQDSIVYDGEMSKVQAIQNAAVAHVYGIQAGIEIKLPAGLGLSTRYNYQVGEEELDDGTTSPSRHAAPAFGITRLSYSYHKLNMQLYGVYSAAVKYEDMPEEEKGKDYLYAIDEDGNPWSPSWYTLNFKAMVQLTDMLSLSAGLENITDQRYRPYSSGIVAPGRNFIISLRATF